MLPWYIGYICLHVAVPVDVHQIVLFRRKQAPISSRHIANMGGCPPHTAALCTWHGPSKHVNMSHKSCVRNAPCVVGGCVCVGVGQVSRPDQKTRLVLLLTGSQAKYASQLSDIFWWRSVPRVLHALLGASPHPWISRTQWALIFHLSNQG